jgi:hypothetical protein
MGFINMLTFSEHYGKNRSALCFEFVFFVLYIKIMFTKRKFSFSVLLVSGAVLTATATIVQPYLSVFSVQQNANTPVVGESVELAEGGSIGFSDQYKYEEFLIKEAHLKATAGKDLMNYKTSINDFSSLKEYVIFITSRRGYGYASNGREGDKTLPFFLYLTNKDDGYDWERTDDFPLYYNGIFKNKLLRQQAFQWAKAVLLEASAGYPADWFPAINKYVDDLIGFVKQGKFPTKAELDDYSATDYWTGFIVRRIVIDGVPKEEILGYLTEAKTALKARTGTKHSHFKTLTVNKELEIRLGAANMTLHSLKSGKSLTVARFHNLSYESELYYFVQYNWPNDNVELMVDGSLNVKN